jgi:hypothetical protein
VECEIDCMFELSYQRERRRDARGYRIRTLETLVEVKLAGDGGGEATKAPWSFLFSNKDNFHTDTNFAVHFLLLYFQTSEIDKLSLIKTNQKAKA